MGVCRSWGIVSFHSFRLNEILCGLVILVCSANRLSPDLDRLVILVCSASRLRLDLNRLNPLCR